MRQGGRIFNNNQQVLLENVMLEAFEEWLKTQEYYTYEEAITQEAWAAALNWVLSWETDKESIEIVQKELGE